jgi:hypothetical protein
VSYLEDVGEVTPARRNQRRSINVHLEEADFDIDVVPIIAPNGLDNPLEVPDRDWDEWVETDPLGYANTLTELNQENGEKIVPLIKMFKHWRDVQMKILRPKSYWLECMVFNLVSDKKITTDGKSYSELFHDLLAAVCEQYSKYLETEKDVPEIRDPMLGKNVAFNWERKAFEAFMRCIDESLNWASKALDAETHDEAIELWQKIFGEEWFPTQCSKGLTFQGSTLYVTSTGKVETEQPRQQSVKVRENRFHGDH